MYFGDRSAKVKKQSVRVFFKKNLDLQKNPQFSGPDRRTLPSTPIADVHFGRAKLFEIPSLGREEIPNRM